MGRDRSGVTSHDTGAITADRGTGHNGRRLGSDVVDDSPISVQERFAVVQSIVGCNRMKRPTLLAADGARAPRQKLTLAS